MSVTHVQVMHDGGRWYIAKLLHQYRAAGRWRAVVTYSTGVGQTYIRGKWADDLRRVGEKAPRATPRPMRSTAFGVDRDAR